MADDVFMIENGTVLRGYPRREGGPAAFEWPNEESCSIVDKVSCHNTLIVAQKTCHDIDGRALVLIQCAT